MDKDLLYFSAHKIFLDKHAGSPDKNKILLDIQAISFDKKTTSPFKKATSPDNIKTFPDIEATSLDKDKTLLDKGKTQCRSLCKKSFMIPEDFSEKSKFHTFLSNQEFLIP